MCKVIYRGLNGVYSLNSERKILSGKIIGIPETICFNGKSIDEVEQDFRNKAEKYLQIMYEEHRRGAKYLDGRISVKVEPEIHYAFQVLARAMGSSTNELIANYMRNIVNNQL